MQSKHKKTGEQDILCLRHARSEFNQGQERYYSQSSHQSYQQFAGRKDFSSDVLYNPKFLDAPLSPHGIEQCKKTKQDNSLKSVNVVLVSPLRRALQTAQIVFGYLNVPIIVCPQITESFRYGCDLSIPIEEKKAQFTNFNFDNVKGYEQFWEITKILGENNRKKFQQFMQKNSEKSIVQQQKMICQLLGADELCQSDQELRERVGKIKQVIKKYKESYNKIAIVSHWWTLTFLMAEGYSKSSYPLSSPDVANARPIWTSLEKLLRYK